MGLMVLKCGKQSKVSIKMTFLIARFKQNIGSYSMPNAATGRLNVLLSDGLLLYVVFTTFFADNQIKPLLFGAKMWP